jgi:CHAT domain-containing protein
MLLDEFERRNPGARSTQARALIAAMRGDQALAAQLNTSVIDELEDIYASTDDPVARESGFSPLLDVYSLLITLSVQRGDSAAAFQLVERSRARVLRDLLVQRRIATRDPGESELLARYQSLRSRMAATPAGAPASDVTRLRSDLEALEERIRSEHPSLLELVAPAPVTLADAEELARTHDLDLVEYYLTGAGVLIWHISPESARVAEVSIPNELLNRKIGAVVESMRSPDAPFDAKTAHELYLLLLDPIADQLGRRPVVVIPHQRLHRLPFSALTTDRDGDRFVADEWALSYAPSLSVLAELTPRPWPAEPRVLMLSSAAIGTTLDEQLHHTGARITPVRNASETAAKRMVPGYDIVHIDAHGEFDRLVPLESCVELAPGDEDDGRLTAAEMFGLDLDAARLVVLAACETGVSGNTSSGELTGIPRALLYAGADSVLLSRWRIDDRATRRWLTSFYAATGDSLPRRVAAASRSVRQAEGTEHPHFWASFFLIGL